MIRSAKAVLIVGILGVIPSAWSEQRSLDRTFDVAPGGALSVEADGGDITVTGTDTKQVVVHVVADGPAKALEGLTLSAEQSDTGVAVIVKRSSMHWLGGQWNFGSNSIRVNITVPRRYAADLRSSGGDIVVRQLQGNATGRTSGGDMRVADVQGAVKMTTSGGDMTLESIQGRVEARTSGGDIVARSLRGDLDARTSGGTVRAEGITGAVKLGSSGGDVLAERVVGPLEARTTGGNILLEKMDGRVQANTSGGKISVELNGANRGIDASTSGSDIVLRLPSAVTATVDATAGSGKVKSELPITGTLDGKSKLQGTINGGGERIYARTSGGNVLLVVKQ